MAIGGGIGGIACAFITGPTELVKIKVQVLKNKEHAPYKGSLSCAVHLVNTQGFLSLGRGMTATMLRDVPGYVAYFLSYYACKTIFIGECESKIWEQTPKQLLGQLAAGSVAGVVGWLPGYPFEIVKTRIQAGQYDRIRTCIKEGLKKEGYKLFYRGLGITVFRAIPVNAATFLVYETLMDLLSHFHH